MSDDDSGRPGRNERRTPKHVTDNMKALGQRTDKNVKEQNKLDVEWVQEICRLCFLYKNRANRDDIKQAVRGTGIWHAWANRSGNITESLAPNHIVAGLPELVALKEQYPTRVSAIRNAAIFICRLSDIDDEAALEIALERYPTMASYVDAREEAGVIPKRAIKKTKEEMAIARTAKLLKSLGLDPADLQAVETKEAELIALARRYAKP